MEFQPGAWGTEACSTIRRKRNENGAWDDYARARAAGVRIDSLEPPDWTGFFQAKGWRVAQMRDLSDEGVRLPPGVDDRAVEAALAAVRVEAFALSRQALARRDVSGLLLGFAAFSPARIRNSIATVAAAGRTR